MLLYDSPFGCEQTSSDVERSRIASLRQIPPLRRFPVFVKLFSLRNFDRSWPPEAAFLPCPAPFSKIRMYIVAMITEQNLCYENRHDRRRRNQCRPIPASRPGGKMLDAPDKPDKTGQNRTRLLNQLRRSHLQHCAFRRLVSVFCAYGLFRVGISCFHTSLPQSMIQLQFYEKCN